MSAPGQEYPLFIPCDAQMMISTLKIHCDGWTATD